jgi:hypothetical protein
LVSNDYIKPSMGYMGFQDRSHQPLGHLSSCCRVDKRDLGAWLVYNTSGGISVLREQAERLGMKLHDLGEVGQEIGQAVVTGVGMILVFDAFFLQFLV